MRSAALTLPGLWAQCLEKKRRWGGGRELPGDACCEQRFVLDYLQWGQHSGLWAFYGHCAFPKNGFYKWMKAYKMGQKVWGGADMEYFSNIQTKMKKTIERLMHFIYRPSGKKNQCSFGPLLVMIRSVCWENKTLCIFNLYFLIFHGTGH